MIGLYFICPFVLLILTLIFSFIITEKLPMWVTLGIGRINADDVRNMTEEQRSYLRSKVRIHFVTALIATTVISIACIKIINLTTWQGIVLCNLIDIAVALVITLSVVKAANKLKEQL